MHATQCLSTLGASCAQEVEGREGGLYKAEIYPIAMTYSLPLQLASTEEFIDGQFTGNLGEVLIR